MATLNGIIKPATIGQVGFDTASTVTQKALQEAHNRGYTFAIRYIRRKVAHDGDLKHDEAQMILDSGLSLMAVQYVESENSWDANAAKGTQNGNTGVEYAQSIGLPPGMNVWCDLEGVSTKCPAADVDAYCRAWFNAVSGAGYVPGLYVGFHPGLNPQQLFKLPFTHYWRSFNLNDDQVPAVRGTQMRQRSAKALPGLDPSTYDEDVITGDKKGGVPLMLSAH